MHNASNVMASLMLAATLIPALSSCNVARTLPEKEEIISEEKSNGGNTPKVVVISATMENRDTKTSLGPYNGSNYPVLWSSGDKFSLLSAGANEQFTISNTDNGEFSGTIADEYAEHWALYPYSSSASISGSTITFSLPETQSYADHSFGNGALPMAGKLNGTDISFKNLCGMLRIALTGSSKVQSITVSDNDGAALCGTATVNTGNLSAGASVSGKTEVKLDCGSGVQLSGSAVSFYIVVPVGVFGNGFTMTVKTDGGTYEKSTTADNTIVRSEAKSMPELSQSSLTPAAETFNIMNSVVKEYIENESFTDSELNSGTSKFTNGGYKSKADNLWKQNSGAQHTDWPQPVTMSTSISNGTSVTLYLSDGTAVPASAGKVNNGSVSFTNLVPGKTYYFMENGQKRAFKTEGQVRMIKVNDGNGSKDDTFNVRDLGGWTGLNGKTVAYEKIYRGGNLDNLNSTNKTMMQNLGILAETDFRGCQAEYNAGWSTNYNFTGGPCGSECKINSSYTYFHKCCDYSANDYMMSGYASGDILESTAKLIYPDNVGGEFMHITFIIDAILHNKPVYFHCKSGADRTGACSFLVLGLLGVAPSDVIKDYELTSFASESNYNDNTFASNINRTYKGGNGKGNAIFEAYHKLMEIDFPSGYLNTGSTWSKDGKTYRYDNFVNTKLNAPADCNTLQKKIYYYLNKYFMDGSSNYGHLGIPARYLDKFISVMLDIPYADVVAMRPSWAYDITDSQAASFNLSSVYGWKINGQTCGDNKSYYWPTESITF